MKTKYVIFDLDDTLMSEIDYLKSAFKSISIFLDSENSQELFCQMIVLYADKKDVFEYLNKHFSEFSKDYLLQLYRNHIPDIKLNEHSKFALNFCLNKGYKIGLITDGRSVTQRNKLKSLDIEHLFDQIIISEEFGSTKPNPKNFEAFVTSSIDDYYYIADNVKKDFIIPNNFGWKTICLLDSGLNIHPQNFDLSKEFLPQFRIENLTELDRIIK
jgi:putative hydrolase of the HAD superfamily